MIFPAWLGFCLLFCILFMSCISSHCIICIASALVAIIVFFNLHLLVVAASPLILLTARRPTLFFVFPSCLIRRLSVKCTDHLVCVSETYPNPTRAVTTDGSGLSPNIPKISLVSLLDSHSILFSTVRLRPEGSDSPYPIPTCYI